MKHFKIFIVILISAFVFPGICKAGHKKLLGINSDLGYALDKSYYDAGTQVDMVIFDLKELKRQGRKYPDELMKSASNADKLLRSKWLKLEQRRVALWENYSRANATSLNSMEGKLNKLRQDVNSFAEFSSKLAEEIKQKTAVLRRELVYKFKSADSKWWSNNFVRALDLSYKVYGVKRFKHPGNYMNMEYAAKACYDLGLNLLSLEVRQKHQDEMLKLFNSYCGTPFLLWGSDYFFMDRDCVSFKYYGDREKLKQDVLRYIAKYRNYKFFAGIQLDEPTINDSSKHYGKLLNVRGVPEAYAKYIGKRRAHLEKNGIEVSNKVFNAKPKNPNQQALYIEWQMFKKQFMANHYKWFFEMMLEQGKFASTVVMNKNFSTPQECSYVSMGHALPYLGTDIYQNGSAVESFAIQLLKNSALKRAIFWPGAGYSCKSSDTFKRTIATGITHADGIHMWTYSFCSKYRDANYFWRYGGSRPNFDDKRRIALYNWYPWAWDIMKKMYKLAADADKYLGNRESVAQTAVLVSERTLIANRLIRGAIRRYWDNNLGVYCSIIKDGIPVNVCFIESLTPEKMKKYKVLIASDMQSISSNEINMLKSWVKNGGTLISSGGITLRDEWGRMQKNYALADIIGADFKNWNTGAQNFIFSKISLQYPDFENYASVNIQGKAKAAKWQLGTPALILNRYGRGLSYYFTAKNLGTKIRTAYKGCGLMDEMYPGFDRLLCKIIKGKTKSPITFKALPKGVEMQIQKNNSNYIVNLVNWYDKRKISGHSIKIKMPEKWKLIYPGSRKVYKIESGKELKLREFDIYQMIILEKGN